MKLKTLSLVAGFVALTISAAPLGANAQSRFSTPMQIAQNQGEQLPRKFDRLGLSAEQRSQIQGIMQQSRSQMAAILTPEQRQRWEAAKNSGNKKAAMRELNLTTEQRSQMRAIKDSTKQQINAVLTPEQRTQLEQFKQNASNRRQSRGR